MTAPLLTAGDVARLLGVQPKTVHEWAAAQKIDCIRAPKFLRFTQAHVDEFIRRHEQRHAVRLVLPERRRA